MTKKFLLRELNATALAHLVLVQMQHGTGYVSSCVQDSSVVEGVVICATYNHMRMLKAMRSNCGIMQLPHWQTPGLHDRNSPSQLHAMPTCKECSCI